MTAFSPPTERHPTPSGHRAARRAAPYRSYFGIWIGLTWAVTVYGQTAPAANTVPQGGVNTGGTATIGTPVTTGSTTTLTVNQTSPNAIVTWSSFDVGAKASVNFVQPSKTAMILNRVTGDKTSNIAGSITANGVFILENPSGAIFYNGANVSAQSVIVTPSHLNDSSFENGVLSFSAPTGSSVTSPAITVNQGATISAGQAGLVGLVAPQVSNSGTITANLGTILLAGGVTAFTLDLYGDGLVNFDVTDKIGAGAVPKNTVLVTNSSTGKLSAPGGRVQLTAQAADGVVSTLVNAGGHIDAGEKGSISIQGIGGNITIAGDLLAQGSDSASGGTVSVSATGGAVVTTAASRIDTSGGTASGDVSIQAEQSSQLAGTITTPGNVTVTTPSQAKVTHTGTINAATVNFAGPVQVSSTGSVNAQSVDFDMSAEVLGSVNAAFIYVSSDATLSLAGNGQLSTASALQDNGTFDISGASHSVSVGSLNGDGAIALGGNNLTLTAASSGVNDVSDGSAFSGSITDGGLAGGVGGSLTVNSGTLMLFGDNTYTGPTLIDTGATVRLVDGSIASSRSVIANGTFDVSSSWAPQITSLAGNGSVLLGEQGLTLTNAAGSFGGVIANGPDQESAGNGLSVTGGTQILSGQNTYTGTTTVEAGGTLQLGNGGQGGSVATDIVNNGTLIIDRDADTVLSTAITGTGQMQIEGGGTLTQATGADISQSLISTGDSVFNGSILLNGDNTVPALGHMAATGDISIRTNSALDLTGLISTPGTLTVQNAGTLRESADGAISAGVLTTGAGAVTGDTVLSGANTIGTLGRFVVQNGTFALNTTSPLSLDGPLVAHAIDVTAAGNLTLGAGGSLFLSPRSATDLSTLSVTGTGATLQQAGTFYINDGPLQSAYASTPATVTLALPGTGSMTLGGAGGQLLAPSTNLVLRLGDQATVTGNVDLLSLTLYGGAAADMDGTLGGVTGTQAAGKALAYSADTTRDRFNGCVFGATTCTTPDTDPGTGNNTPAPTNPDTTAPTQNRPSPQTSAFVPVIANPLSSYGSQNSGSGNSAGTSLLGVKGSEPKDALGSNPLFSYSPRTGPKHRTDSSIYLPGVAGQDY
ncbi:MAG: filamentous hemagglutinin N-terminal domain-containing protein [Acetobacter sp.]|uniref:beta strand repeat-containing protein n=1 Tax=Acetobacter sp. TaxID=440 RepID=UPI0039E7D47F